MKRLAVVSTICILATINVALADEIGDDLEKARTEWKNALRTATLGLEDEIQSTIDRLAETGDLDAVKVVREEEKAFADSGRIPTSAALLKAATAYKQVRRKESDRLLKSMRKAVADYTKGKLFDQAEALDAETKEFARSEKQLIEGQSAPVSTKAEKSIAIIRDFSNRFHSQLDVVLEEPTTAKRDVAHTAMVKKLDEELRGKSITLRFPIRDIREESTKNKYEVSLGTPEEFAEIDGMTNHLKHLTGVQLKKEDALKTKPDDIIVVTGTPRFAARTYSDGGAIAVIEFRPKGKYREAYCVFLQNFKVAIERAK